MQSDSQNNERKSRKSYRKCAENKDSSAVVSDQPQSGNSHDKDTSNRSSQSNHHASCLSISKPPILTQNAHKVSAKKTPNAVRSHESIPTSAQRRQRNKVTFSHASSKNSCGHTTMLNLDDALFKLSSEKEYHVNNSLIWIRSTFIKQKDGPAKLIQSGGLEKLLKILRGTNSKWHDVSLSILGNVFTEDKARIQIMRLDGIRTIIHILKSSDVEQIQNRACRTIANLAQNQKCSKVIHNEGVLEDEDDFETSSKKPVTKRRNAAIQSSSLTHPSSSNEPKTASNQSKETIDTSVNNDEKDQTKSTKSSSTIERIVDLLENTNNKECQLTYLRALRLLGDTPRHRDAIVECQGVKVICMCLRSTSTSVLLLALKTAAHFLHLTETEPAVWQFVNAEGSKSLLSLADHRHPDVSKTASSILLTFVKHDLLRPCLGSAGAIQHFIERIKIQDNAPVDNLPFVNAVCLFCKEVVNRAKIRNAGGLELFLKVLDNPEYSVLHFKLVSALVFFLYDDTGMEILLRNDMVRILMDVFKKCAKIEDIKMEDVLLTHVKGNDDSNENCDERNNLSQNIDNISDAAPSVREESNEISTSESVSGDMTETYESLDTTKRNKSPGPVDVAFDRSFVITSEDNTIEEKKEDRTEIEGQDQNASTSKQVPKYSIDSPTYKSMSDWTFEANESGPMNIFDAQKSQQVGSSCEELSIPYDSPPHSGPYTPMSTSPYHSPSWSWTSSPSRSISPTSFSSGSASPRREHSPSWSHSPGFSDCSTMQRSTSEGALSDMSTLSWPGSSPNRSRSVSPVADADIMPRPLSPLSSPPRSPSSNETRVWWSSPSSPLQHSSRTMEQTGGEIGNVDSTNQTNEPIGKKRKRNPSDQITEKAAVDKSSADDALPCSQDTTYSSPLYKDPVYEQSMYTDFGKALRGENIFRQVSTDSTVQGTAIEKRSQDKNNERGEKGIETKDNQKTPIDKHSKSGITNEILKRTSSEGMLQRPKKGDVVSKGAFKRRRSDRWSTSTDRSVDGKSTMVGADSQNAIDSAHSSVADVKSVVKPKHSSNANKSEDINKASANPAKTTEDSILVVLSKLSYAEEPSAFLLCQDVVETLILYLLCAKRPFHRAERILHRLCSNAKCFACVIKLNVPILLHLASVCHSDNGHSDESKVNLSKDSSGKKRMEDKDRKDRKLNETIERDETSEKLDNFHNNLDIQSSFDNTLTEPDSVQEYSNPIRINTKCCDALKDVLTQVSLVLMSEYGRGVVQHVMLSGSDVDKQTCVLALAICCRDSDLLKECLVTRNGLQVLLDLNFKPDIGDIPLIYSSNALHRLAVQTDMLMLHHGIGMRSKLPAFKFLDHEPHHVFLSLMEESTTTHSSSKNKPKLAFQKCCKAQNSDNYKRKLAYVRGQILEAASQLKEVTEVDDHDSKKNDSTKSDAVEFKVEGKLVHADAEVMCNKSQVFNAMLRGHYVESGKSQIEIKDAPFVAFRILCDILHGDTAAFCALIVSCFYKVSSHDSENIPCDSMDQQMRSDPHSGKNHSSEMSSSNNIHSFAELLKEINQPEDVCLDILRLADRFMLQDVIHDVTMIFYGQIVNSSNVVRVLEFAVSHNCTLLASRCITFMTSQCVSLETRTAWYHTLRQSPCLEEVTECCYDVIKSHLPLKLSICKSD